MHEAAGSIAQKVSFLFLQWQETNSARVKLTRYISHLKFIYMWRAITTKLHNFESHAHMIRLCVMRI